MKKDWIKSKAMWAAAFMLLTAAYQFTTNGEFNLDVWKEVLLALGIIGLRSAMD